MGIPWQGRVRVEPSPKACGMWIVEHRLWNVLKNVESGSWNMGYGMWDQGRVIWNVVCGSLMYEPHPSKRLAQGAWAGGFISIYIYNANILYKFYKTYISVT